MIDTYLMNLTDEAKETMIQTLRSPQSGKHEDTVLRIGRHEGDGFNECLGKR